MGRRLIDLSVPLENDVAANPKGLGPSITYLDHAQTREQMLRFFPGLTADDLPDREGWATELVALTAHEGFLGWPTKTTYNSPVAFMLLSTNVEDQAFRRGTAPCRA